VHGRGAAARGEHPRIRVELRSLLGREAQRAPDAPQVIERPLHVVAGGVRRRLGHEARGVAGRRVEALDADPVRPRQAVGHRARQPGQRLAPLARDAAHREAPGVDLTAHGSPPLRR
jgi:hypothetical protein